MVMEPLAEVIRMNQSFKGVTIEGTLLKINLFADDVILTLTDSETSLSDALKTFDAFDE